MCAVLNNQLAPGLRYTVIQLNEAPCLKATTNPLSVAIAQPLDDLYISEGFGPHYSAAQAEDASARVNEFLRIVKETDSELAIAPEYFLPLQIAKKILVETDQLHRGTLYILPIETLRFSDFEELLKYLKSDKTWNKYIAKYEKTGNLLDKCVNAVLILYVGETQRLALIQLKTKPARPESSRMVRGSEILAIEGESGGLSVAMCADVNPPLPQVWSDIAKRKPISYTVHCQWNPKPDFEHYYTQFWSALLNDEGGAERLIFSINWCRGSRLIGSEGPVTLNRQSNRFIRGRTMQKGYMYRQRSLSGLHLQQRTESENARERWEIWYCLAKTDNIRVICFVRPRQGVPPAQSDMSRGIVSASFWERNTFGSFINATPQNLAQPYLERLRKEVRENTSVEELLSELSLCELETFSSACNMDFPASWLEENADARIPTSFILCHNSEGSCDAGGRNPCPQLGKTCSLRRQELEDKSTNVALCLDVLANIRQQGVDVRADVSAAYPANIRSGTTGRRGWVMHGQGWPARKVGKRLRELLEDSNTRKSIKALDLYRTDGVIGLRDILNVPADIFKADAEIEEDTFATHHLPILGIPKVGQGGPNG